MIYTIDANVASDLHIVPIELQTVFAVIADMLSTGEDMAIIEW